ncbi:hypothetical protein GCM10027258_80780 [Amycolatopsis stemonae]
MSTTTTAGTATPATSFAERAAEFARARGYAPFEAPDLAGTALRQREELVRWHGGADDPFNREWVYPGRTVIEVPGLTWPAARPEECSDDSGRGIWFAADGSRITDATDPNAPDGIALLCPQCGLDST